MKKKKNLLARKENLLAQLNFWWPRASGRRLMRRLGKAEYPSNLNCEQKSLLKRAPGPGCVQCEVIYLYYQVEAEAELRGWQDFGVGPKFGSTRKQPIIPGNSRARSSPSEEDRVT